MCWIFLARACKAGKDVNIRHSLAWCTTSSLYSVGVTSLCILLLVRTKLRTSFLSRYVVIKSRSSGMSKNLLQEADMAVVVVVMMVLNDLKTGLTRSPLKSLPYCSPLILCGFCHS